MQCNTNLLVLQSLIVNQLAQTGFYFLHLTRMVISDICLLPNQSKNSGVFMFARKEVQREGKLDLNFINELRKIPGGEKIVDCIQCGTCSGSCPTSYLMHHTPRKLIAMTRAGMRKEVLKSPDIWLCTSCYSCYVRCPRGIKVTDLMYAYKRLSVRDKFGLQKRGFKLGKYFMQVVNKYGRNNELELLAKFFTFANPIGGLLNSLIGWNLYKRNRLPLKQHKIKDLEGFKKIVRKAETL